MTHGTDPQAQQPTPAQQPVTYFWIATIEKPNGDKVNCHATAQATPGIQTRDSVYRDVLAFLESRHRDFVVLPFSLELNELAAPTRPAVTS